VLNPAPLTSAKRGADLELPVGTLDSSVRDDAYLFSCKHMR
jgi:hypothetical protein